MAMSHHQQPMAIIHWLLMDNSCIRSKGDHVILAASMGLTVSILYD